MTASAPPRPGLSARRCEVDLSPGGSSSPPPGGLVPDLDPDTRRREVWVSTGTPPPMASQPSTYQRVKREGRARRAVMTRHGGAAGGEDRALVAHISGRRLAAPTEHGLKV